jgi:hypothetical protein
MVTPPRFGWNEHPPDLPKSGLEQGTADITAGHETTCYYNTSLMPFSNSCFAARGTSPHWFAPAPNDERPNNRLDQGVYSYPKKNINRTLLYTHPLMTTSYSSSAAAASQSLSLLTHHCMKVPY